MSLKNVLSDVADKINAGALGPNVTASVSPRVRKLAGKIIEAGFVEEAQEAIEILQAKEDLDRKAKDSSRHSLPPEDMDELHQFRGMADKKQWELGRRIEILAVKYAGKISLSKIWKDAASAAECSRAQIRKCHETWTGTDDSLREEFDVLTFEHFYTAVLYCPDRDARARALGWCLDTAPDFGGRPAPAAVLARKLKKAPPEPTWTELQARAVSSLEHLRDVAHERTHDRLNKIIAEVEGMQQ